MPDTQTPAAEPTPTPTPDSSSSTPDQTSSTEDSKTADEGAVKTLLDRKAEEPKGDEPKAEPKPDTDHQPLKLDALEVPDGLLTRDEKTGDYNPEELARVESFLEIVNDEKVPAAAANRMLGLWTKMQTEAAEATWKNWQSQNDKWVEELKSDPEIGGDKLEPAVGKIGDMVNEFGEPGFLEAMAATGAGNHPAIVKTLAKIAHVMREGDLVKGSSTQDQPTSLADLMYKSEKGDG